MQELAIQIVVALQVYGLKPTTDACKSSTTELAGILLKYFRAPEEVMEDYEKNLAILVLYIKVSTVTNYYELLSFNRESL